MKQGEIRKTLDQVQREMELILRYNKLGVRIDKIHVSTMPSMTIFSYSRNRVVGEFEPAQEVEDGVVTTRNNVFITMECRNSIDVADINDNCYAIVVTDVTYNSKYRFGIVPHPKEGIRASMQIYDANKELIDRFNAKYTLEKIKEIMSTKVLYKELSEPKVKKPKARYRIVQTGDKDFTIYTHNKILFFSWWSYLSGRFKSAEAAEEALNKLHYPPKLIKEVTYDTPSPVNNIDI